MARKLEVEIVGDASKLHKTLDQASRSSKRFGGTLGALKTGVVAAGGALAGGLVIGLEKSIHAAIDAEKSEARLTQAFKNQHIALAPLKGKIDDLEASGRKLGFTDVDTTTALGSLITATGSYSKSARELAIAQNLARFKGVSLTDATKALTMAQAGSLRALKQLGLDVPKVTTAQDALKAATKDHTSEAYKNALAEARQQDKAATLANVLDTVTKATKGQADTYSKTAAGAMAQFHAQLDHIEVEIGKKLLPVMVQAVQWITNHWPEISRTVRQAWLAIKPDINAFIDLTKTLVETIRRYWGQIEPIVKPIYVALKDQLKSLADFIRVIDDLLHGDWGKAWKAAVSSGKDAAGALKNQIAPGVVVLKDAVNGTVTAIKDLVRWLGHKFVAPVLAPIIRVFNALADAITAAVHAVEDLIHALGSIHVPKIHIPGAGIIHKIPGLAEGGTVMSRGLAMVGESGPELLNLPAGASVTPLSSGGDVHFHFPNYVGDKRELMNLLRAEAQRFKQQTGRSAFA